MAVLSSAFIGFAKVHRPESVLMPDHRFASFSMIFFYFSVYVLSTHFFLSLKLSFLCFVYILL